MARNRQDIKNEITTAFISNKHIVDAYALDVTKTFAEQFSLVSFENILFDIISYTFYLFEQVFGKHQEEVNELIYNQKTARLPWYRFMALKFQYGFDLIVDTDNYNNTGYTDEQIEASKIIKYAAVTESDDESRVIIKIATETNGELAPIGTAERDAFNAYIREVRPAGVKITIINYLPDLLYPTLVIYRDALVLDENGQSIINGNYPVNEAIEEFMKELPFNGEFIIQSFVDKLQKVEGVKIAHVANIETAWIDPTTNGYSAPVSVSVKTIPISGYFKVDNYNNISYVV